MEEIERVFAKGKKIIEEENI